MTSLNDLADRMLWRLEDLSKGRFQTKAKQGFDLLDSVWGAATNPYKKYKGSFACSALESRNYGDYDNWRSISELEKSAISVFGDSFRDVWGAFLNVVPYGLRISIPANSSDFTAKDVFLFLQRDLAYICVLIEVERYDIIKDAFLSIEERGSFFWPSFV